MCYDCIIGMGGIAGPELVAAVTLAGGFGVFGSALDVANKGPEELLEQIKHISQLCQGKPFGVGKLQKKDHSVKKRTNTVLIMKKCLDILVHGAEGGVMKQLIDAFAEGGAKAFISGKGVPSRKVIDQFHSKDMLVGSIAGKLSHATRAVELGVDFIVVQGCEVG
jgi:NAD(P)H-dependent flavin oxidoreductase YrpB (nitropropane dioxygenase family)